MCNLWWLLVALTVYLSQQAGAAAKGVDVGSLISPTPLTECAGERDGKESLPLVHHHFENATLVQPVSDDSHHCAVFQLRY